MAIRIGELLIKKGLVNPDQLETALRDQATSGEFLGNILIRLGYITEENLLTALAEQFQTRFVSLEKVYVNPQVIKMVPGNLVREYKFLPIEMRSGVMLIAVSNPLDMWPMSVLHQRIELSEITIVLAKKDDIQKAIQKHYGAEGVL